MLISHRVGLGQGRPRNCFNFQSPGGHGSRRKPVFSCFVNCPYRAASVAAILGMAHCEGSTPYFDAIHGALLGNCSSKYCSMPQLCRVGHRSFLPGSLRGRVHATLYHSHWAMVSSRRATASSFDLEFNERNSDYGSFCLVVWPWSYPLRCVEAVANVSHHGR